jgi:hypothetical protein
MNYEKLLTAIYAEEDLGRSVAIAVAGVTGLVVYRLSADWVTAVFSSVILFPLARVAATAMHSRWKSKRSETAQALSAETEFNRFSPEERQILEFFVRQGGCCVSWSAVNRSEFPFPRAALNSMMERGLVRTSVMEDGMTESFVLKVEMFDVAQKAFNRKLGAEQAVQTDRA